MTFATDEIIKIRIGKKWSRNYRGFKGTFSILAYNSQEKKTLPGFHDTAVVMRAKQSGRSLSLTLSGDQAEEALMEIMDIALRNASAFPSEAGRAHFSITIHRALTP